MTLNDMFLK